MGIVAPSGLNLPPAPGHSALPGAEIGREAVTVEKGDLYLFVHGLPLRLLIRNLAANVQYASHESG